MTAFIFKGSMSLLTTYLITRLIVFILRKIAVHPAVAAGIAAAMAFLLQTGIWLGTPYAASAAAYYGASSAVWLTFDLYRSVAPGESKSDSR